MKHRMCVLMVVMSFGLGLMLGCNQSKREEVKTVDVSGKVTLDGKPLQGVAVHFTSSLKHEGTGVTGADGSYKLATGAEPGENKVYVTEVSGVAEGEDTADTSGAENTDGGGGGAKKQSAVPAKYRNAASPALTFTVPPEGSTEANFDLTSK